MPLKKPILIASVITLALITILIVTALLPKSDQSPNDTEPPVVQVMFDTNHIDHLEGFSYRYQGKDSVSVVRTDNGWQIADRPELPLDPEAVSLMLSGYRQILALRTVTETVDNLAEYGLDTPTLEVTLIDHGTEKTYLFGDENKVYEGYYCMVKGSTEVYLLDVSYYTAFETPMEKLLLAERLPDLSAMESIHWTSANGVVAEDTNALTAALSTLTVDRLIDYGSEKYPSYGLDRPAVGAITLADGSTQTLRFAKGESDELVYLLIGEREIIYLVSCDHMSTLLDYIVLNKKTDG